MISAHESRNLADLIWFSAAKARRAVPKYSTRDLPTQSDLEPPGTIVDFHATIPCYYGFVFGRNILHRSRDDLERRGATWDDLRRPETTLDDLGRHDATLDDLGRHGTAAQLAA